MQEEKRICPNCLKEMERLSNMPTYACAWCERQETESGIVLSEGTKK